MTGWQLGREATAPQPASSTATRPAIATGATATSPATASAASTPSVTTTAANAPAVSSPCEPRASDASPCPPSGDQSPEQTAHTADPGAYHPPPIVVDRHARLYPLTRNVWVRPTPSDASSWIGFLWFGSSVRLREPEGRAGSGCKGRWYGIEPRGYVCVDETRATLDPEHPTLRGIMPYAPNLASPWPHRYGESIDLQRYVELPSVRVQRAREAHYRSHQALLSRARSGEMLDALLGVDTSLPAPVDLELPLLPRGLQMGHDRLQARSTVAWSREQLHEGRGFLLTADLTWVPKDRVRPYPTVTFHGVRLGRDARLPLAFIRGKDRPRYRESDGGELVITEGSFTRLSWVELTGREKVAGDEVFLETRQDGLFVRRSDAVIPRVARTTPWGTPLGSAESDESRHERTWMEASILGGWLLAYRGHTPVFATLVSAGRGGLPRGDIDPVETASTPVGRFKITGKFATATMIAPNELTHSDVPWAQNFSGPHALHAAYWHDRWGELKSGGCLNLSPIDARYLFYEFTQPRVPEGWHGVRWDSQLEPATTLIVGR